MVRRRRMTRHYDNLAPVARGLIDYVVDAGRRAPSAGFSQGWHFLVLDEPVDVARYWNVTAPADPADAWLTGMMTAPALVVVYSDRAAYERRYAGADKQRPSTEQVSALDQRWPVPYWHIDAGMAALLIQLAAIDAGLVCCWFGVPTDRVAALAAAFGVPTRMTPVGVVSLGYSVAAPTTARARAHRPRAEVVSYGRFSDGRGPDAVNSSKPRQT